MANVPWIGTGGLPLLGAGGLPLICDETEDCACGGGTPATCDQFAGTGALTPMSIRIDVAGGTDCPTPCGDCDEYFSASHSETYGGDGNPKSLFQCAPFFGGSSTGLLKCVGSTLRYYSDHVVDEFAGLIYEGTMPANTLGATSTLSLVGGDGEGCNCDTPPGTVEAVVTAVST